MSKIRGIKPRPTPTPYISLSLRADLSLSLAVRQAAALDAVSMSEYLRRLLVADTTARGLLVVPEAQNVNISPCD